MQAVLDLRAKLGVPHTLKDFKVDGAQRDKIGDMAIVDPTAGGNPVELTICVGISTSHGKIREAKEIKDYLDIGRRHGVHGASIFTWETLQPYLPEVKEAGYFEEFTSGLQPPKP